MLATKNRIHSQRKIPNIMKEFSPVTPTDRELITSYITPATAQDCDLSFANLCSWHFLTESAYALLHGQLVIRFRHAEGYHEYFPPLGGSDLRTVIRTLEIQAQAEGTPLYLRGVTPNVREQLEEAFPGKFAYHVDRNLCDYIYRRQELVELKGKNYQPKRNHINKFNKAYAHTYEPMTPANIDECLRFEADWCLRHGYTENETIRQERRALTFALRHFEALGLTGGVLRVDGRMAAFTFGAPINKNTFGVHFEKADIAVDGAYSAINQLFAAHLPEQYLYLNREEDLGIPGLRQAKLSYHPCLLLEKATALKTDTLTLDT